MTFLSIQNVSIAFGKTKALTNISIELERGEYLVVLGPSGAGKTSLLKCISGLYKPNAGKIKINSLDVTKLPPEERAVAYMPQNYALFNKMDVWENVSYGPKIQGKSKEEISDICNNILEMVHLEKRKTAFPDELSGGMKQRTSLARSLATNFPILLLDEPLRALDARLRIELRTELRQIVKKLGFTVLHVTHDQNEAMAVADKILILDHGKIVQIGSQYDIYFNPKTLFVPAFMDEINTFTGIIIEKELQENLQLKNGYADEDLNKSYYKYILQTNNGLSLESLTNSNFEIKEIVNIVIKAESIRVKKSNGNRANKSETEQNDEGKRKKLLGILSSHYFLGNWSKLRITVDSYDWIIKLPSIRSEGYQEGEMFELSFKPINVLILPKSSEN